MKINRIVSCFIVLGCLSCNRNDTIDNENYMGFTEISYCKEFSKIVNLEKANAVKKSKEGVKFRIVDGLLIDDVRNTDGMWKISNITTGEIYGAFLKKGNAEQEFLDKPEW